MDSWFEVELFKNNVAVPNSKKIFSKVSEHPGFWASGMISVKAIENNIISLVQKKDPNKVIPALNSIREVLEDSDTRDFALQHIYITNAYKGKFDKILIRFVASSEDDLKVNACKIIYCDEDVKSEKDDSIKDKQHIYALTFKIDTNILGIGSRNFLFAAGGQDDGFIFDCAAISTIDINYISEMRFEKICYPERLDPPPACHNSPDIYITDEIAERFASINVFLDQYNETGILFDPEHGDDSDVVNLKTKDDYFNWAKNPNSYYKWHRKSYSNIPKITIETVRKIRILSRLDNDLFARTYAIFCKNNEKFLNIMDSQTRDEYYKFASNTISSTGNTVQVRDDLIDKIYKAFEDPVTYNIKAK